MRIVKAKAPRVSIEYYKDKRDEWRWRFKSNGKIMADSGEGYSTKNACLKAIKTVKQKIVDAEPKEVE